MTIRYIDRHQLPETLPPRVGCDFNACGWSGEEDDDCFYVLDREDLRALPASDGLRVLLFEWEDPGCVLACLATLETWGGGWRARPRSGFYSGPTPW